MVALIVMLLLIVSSVVLSLPLMVGRTPPARYETVRPRRGDEDMAAAVDEAVECVDRAAQARERELTRGLLAGRVDRATYRSRMNELAHGGSTQVETW